MSSEIWKQVVGYEGMYEVSNLGRVRGVDRVDVTGYGNRRGKMKSQMTSAKGYKRVALHKLGAQKKHSVHTLVLLAFIGSKPTSAHEARHKNGSRDDNADTNLEWGTSTQNNADRKGHGTLPRGETHPNASINEATARLIKARLESFPLSREVAAEFHVSKAVVDQIRSGKTWAHL